jgi:hypothetical protein
MPAPPLEEMRIVASRLKPLNVPFAFVGGAVMCLLVDHPELTDFRRTKDDGIRVRDLGRFPLRLRGPGSRLRWWFHVTFSSFPFMRSVLVSGLNLHRTEGIFAIILREVEFSCSEHG